MFFFSEMMKLKMKRTSSGNVFGSIKQNLTKNHSIRKYFAYFVPTYSIMILYNTQKSFIEDGKDER